MIEEHVIKLAELQAGLHETTDRIVADQEIVECTKEVVELEKLASEKRDALHDLVSAYGQDIFVEQIDEIKDQIIERRHKDRVDAMTAADEAYEEATELEHGPY